MGRIGCMIQSTMVRPPRDSILCVCVYPRSYHSAAPERPEPLGWPPMRMSGWMDLDEEPEQGLSSNACKWPGIYQDLGCLWCLHHHSASLTRSQLAMISLLRLPASPGIHPMGHSTALPAVPVSTASSSLPPVWLWHLGSTSHSSRAGLLTPPALYWQHWIGSILRVPLLS